jgi:hypothetical protein
MEATLNMNYPFISTSEGEKKDLEIDPEDVPPNVGGHLQLPFGENKEIRHYGAAHVYYPPARQEKTIFYIEVKPA